MDNRQDGRLTTVCYRMRKAGLPESTITDLEADWPHYTEDERQRLASRSTLQWGEQLASFDAFPISHADVIDSRDLTEPDYPPAVLDADDVAEFGPLSSVLPAAKIHERDDLAADLGASVSIDLADIPTDIRELRIWVGSDPSRARAALAKDRTERGGKPRSTVLRLAREVAGPDV